VSDVHAVADDEKIRDDEADVLGLERLGELARLLEENGDGHPAGAALHHQTLGERDGAAGFQNVVDEQHVAPGNVAFDVADKGHLPGRFGAGSVARQRNELDLRRQPRPVQRADEIGGEDEAALEDGYDEEVAIAGGGDLRGQGEIARRDGLGVKKDA